MEILKTTGNIIFDPYPIKDPSGMMFKPYWIIITIQDDIGLYYKYLLEKRYGLLNHISFTDKETKILDYHSGLKIQRPAWGSHISVCRGEEKAAAKWEELKSKYNNTSIEFCYETEPKTNGRHWWLKVICDQLKDIREELGLQREPFWNFHLTLGSPTPNTEWYSELIWEMFKKGLLNF